MEDHYANYSYVLFNLFKLVLTLKAIVTLKAKIMLYINTFAFVNLHIAQFTLIENFECTAGFFRFQQKLAINIRGFSDEIK